MTNEEAIRIAQGLITDFKCESETMVEFCNTVIKALKQQAVLDKIRAEIEEYKSRQLTLAIGVDDLENGKQITIDYVLAIIDKYKAESEDKEWHKTISKHK